MYLVVSKWRILDNTSDEGKRIAEQMRDWMREQPGVKFVYGFPGSDAEIAVHGYESEDTYNRLIQDPNGPFAKKLDETRFEEYAEWVSSERGETRE